MQSHENDVVDLVYLGRETTVQHVPIVNEKKPLSKVVFLRFEIFQHHQCSVLTLFRLANGSSMKWSGVFSYLTGGAVGKICVFSSSSFALDFHSGRLI